ncbi:hypothetical protein [Mycolicibacterium llatzerense]|uniref:hypothetical protein n=1 Tax=Mycolicibacterium llatzerense TaxID=280871 RepID=UPI0021B5F7ED|nr:hypothetical protein [Mycolicibacterium llatzerense]MCT7372158.1 hypothetical protein [Mycolicibacterium llatzerense]
MSANNARKEAARRYMEQCPGLTYQQAWKMASPDKEESVAAVLAHMKANIVVYEAQLEDMTARDQAAADRAFAASRFHDHVRARFDSDSQLIDLIIDPSIMDTADLAAIITEVLQRTWDATTAEISAGWAESIEAGDMRPVDPHKPGVYSEASHDGTLKLAVNGSGRLLWCEIGDRVFADGWSAADLSARIVLLYQVAVMRSWLDSGLRPIVESGAGTVQTDAEIADFRARLLTF